MPATVLIAGCGDLGCALGRQLVADGLAVIGLRRSAMPLPDGMRVLQADVTQSHTLQGLAALKSDILVYCVAADAQNDDSYRARYVDGLRNVLVALADTDSLRRVFFISSTRVYGQQTDELLDETIPAIPADFGGERLLQAESLLRALPCRGTALRLPGLYGPGRTRLLALARQPHVWPAHNAWTNRIHRDDAAGFIALLIRRALTGAAVDDCYLVTDGCPVPQYDVLRWLAGNLGVDTAGIAIPSVLGGKRLGNARLLAAGYTLRYPDYRAGYAEEIRKQSSDAQPS